VAGLLVLRVGVEVVEGLRQEAGHVDAVGRGEEEGVVEFLIQEGLFDEALAVVERAVDLDGRDVPAERRKLFFLNLADLAFGIEDADLDAGDAEKTVGNGATRVARRGYEDVYVALRCLLALLLADEVAQEAGHEAGTDVLKGGRGAVEELEAIDAVVDGHQGDVKLERVVDDFAQALGVDVFAKEGLSHLVGNLLQR
jgi:hypothetical protein